MYQVLRRALMRRRSVRLALTSLGCLLIEGRAVLELCGPDGTIRERRVLENLIVNGGRNGIADQLLATPTIGRPTHMAIGTGTVAPALTDTALGTEVGTRVSATRTRTTNVVTFEATFGAGNGTGAITEAGIFNAATAGTLYSRITFSVINKGASDSLTLTWTWTIGT